MRSASPLKNVMNFDDDVSDELTPPPNEVKRNGIGSRKVQEKTNGLVDVEMEETAVSTEMNVSPVVLVSGPCTNSEWACSSLMYFALHSSPTDSSLSLAGQSVKYCISNRIQRTTKTWRDPWHRPAVSCFFIL